jgi:catechol 2,3-dioxygenase-like lactoylglutathione lyase family enzyme
MDDGLRPTSLDHVALWVSDRAPLASYLCDHFGMHVIEQTDSFTLLGVDAKLGKLTLFAADGPRHAGMLAQVALRVGNLDTALARLPAPANRTATGVSVDAPQGLRIGLVEAGGEDYDLDHVVLRVPDPERAARAFANMGFERRGARLSVGDREVRLERGDADDGGRPLLNHLALLVDSARDVQAAAARQGLEVDDVKDAPNTFAVFLRGPAGVRVEYVEHKPGFALV